MQMLPNVGFPLTLCRFVNKYTELKRHSELDHSALFKATGKVLLQEGITLMRRTGAAKVGVNTVSVTAYTPQSHQEQRTHTSPTVTEIKYNNTLQNSEFSMSPPLIEDEILSPYRASEK